jgi:simple sugar transport system permease protein
MQNWLDRGTGFAAPVIIAFAVSALILLGIGENPLDVFGLMISESFGSARRVASTLSAATPLLFTAVATALCFRAGVFNVGVDGAFVVAGLAAVVAGFSLPAGLGWALAPLCFAIAAAFGAAWLFLPGWLLARLDVDEVVSTLMLNFIALAITGYLVNGPFLSAESGNNVTPRVHDGAELARLLPPSTLHAGFLVGLAVLAAYAFWIRRTPAGLEGAFVGLNRRFSRAVGISVPRTIIVAMVLSGVIAGLGGAAHGLGQLHRFSDGFSAGYGFTGMAVALLGRNHPVGILLGAVLFGALASAGTTIQLFSNIPLDLVNIIQGVVMIFAVVELGRIAIRRRAVA